MTTVDWGNISNTSSWIDMARLTNYYSGNILGLGILIIIFVVAFVTTYQRDGWKSSMIAASWITAIFAMALSLAEMVSSMIVIGSFLIAVFATIATYYSDY